MDPQLIVIGAGTAGLAVGCYARMNGYRTTIYEMADQPGGLCTSWRRKGYLFDASVAGLAGSAPGSPLYRMWQELGVADGCPLRYGASFGRIYAPDGRCVTVHAEVDRLEAHLVELFPAEARVLRTFTGGIRSVLNLDPPLEGSRGLAALREKVRTACSLASHIPVLLRFGTTTIRDFSKKLRDPFLVEAFHNLVHFGGPDVPLLTVMLPLAYAHRRMAGIPVHGWLSFARAIEKRLLEVGGTVQYGAKVERVEVERGRVRGVILADGTRQAADLVVSAADGRFTTLTLLGRDDEAARASFKPERLSDQPAQVNLGVAEDLVEEDGPVTYLLERPFTAAGREHKRITVHNRCFDPSAAPAGKSSVTVFLDSSYGFWKDLGPDRYREEKRKAADAVIDVIERRRPGFRERVEVIDVSTPLTRERYTGNWMGAMQAWAPSASMIRALVAGRPSYAVKGVEGFFVAGQWAEPWGGITTAAQSGRKAVAAICDRDGKRFRTVVP